MPIKKPASDSLCSGEANARCARSATDALDATGAMATPWLRQPDSRSNLSAAGRSLTCAHCRGRRAWAPHGSAPEDRQEGMREAGAAEATDNVPLDHLLKAVSGLVAGLVEEGGRLGDRGNGAADGGHEDDRAPGEQANRRGLGRVAQRAQGDERSDDEVAVRHADFDSALPRLQALAEHGHVRHVLLGETAVRERSRELVTGEGLLALRPDEEPRIERLVPVTNRVDCTESASQNLRRHDALPHPLNILLGFLALTHLVGVGEGGPQVKVIRPPQLGRLLARAVEVRVALQLVQPAVIRRVLWPSPIW